MDRTAEAGGSTRARRWRGALAIGAASVVLPLVVPAGIAWALAPTPSTAQLPAPADAGPIANATANDVACATAGSCTAVGDYQDTIGITHAMTLNLASGTWTAAAMLAPNDAPDFTFSDLNAVSCSSVGNCVAVGDYRVSTVKTEGFYAVESAGVWVRGLALPLPADAATSPAETTFLGVSCVPGGTVCRMVGEYTTASGVNSVIDTFTRGTGLTGSPVEVSPPAGELGIGLAAISCFDVSTCVAVGGGATAVADVAAFIELNSGVWGSPGTLSNPKGATTPSEYLSGVSCVGVGYCVASGNWLDTHSNGYAETYTLAGGTWGSAVDIGQPSNLNNPFVDSISCVTAVTSCTMVGALSDAAGSLHAASAQETSGAWGQLAPSTVPGSATTDHELLGISCGTGVQCTAVGYFNNKAAPGGTEAMAATWTPGGRPDAVSTLHVAGASSHAIRLAWTPPVNFGSGLAHYEVLAQLAGRATTDRGATIASTFLVSGLVPGATYHFTVLTVATDGQTSVAATLTAAAPPTAPSAPSITRITGVHHGVSVSWRAPRSTGGSKVTGYQVAVHCTHATASARFAGSARTGAVRGLRSGDACVARVTASNRAGASKPSAPAAARTL